MTADSSSTSPLAAHVGGSSGDGPTDLRPVGSETFDVEPPYDAARPTTSAEDRFLDRELSWLHFNQRVLELAEDTSLPLLERVRFLAIFASNLDEFFMVRVAGLKRRIAAGVAVPAASGLMPREVLEEIWTHAAELMERQARAVPRARSSPRSPRRASSWSAGTTSTRDEQRQMQGAVQGAGLPGADAAGGRPRAPVPVHLRAVAEPRGAGAQPGDRQGALRPGQGAADLRALRARRQRSGSCRSRT